MKYILKSKHMGSFKSLFDLDFLFNCIMVRKYSLHILIYSLLICLFGGLAYS